MNAALAAGTTEVQATVNPKAPPIITADLEPMRARLDKITGTQITVTFAEISAHISTQPISGR